MEPDYRFTLANERTFLAWIRTALGLLAGGVAVRELAEPFGTEWVHTALALVAIAASAAMAIGGYLRWLAVQQAARRGESLPSAGHIPVIAFALFVVAVIAFVLVASE